LTTLTDQTKDHEGTARNTWPTDLRYATSQFAARRAISSSQRTVVGWSLNSESSTPYDFFSPHSDMVQFVFVDASVHALSTRLNSDVLQALATFAGGETIDTFEF
jgi:hypothetical protein